MSRPGWSANQLLFPRICFSTSDDHQLCLVFPLLSRNDSGGHREAREADGAQYVRRVETLGWVRTALRSHVQAGDRLSSEFCFEINWPPPCRFSCCLQPLTQARYQQTLASSQAWKAQTYSTRSCQVRFGHLFAVGFNFNDHMSRRVIASRSRVISLWYFSLTPKPMPWLTLLQDPCPTYPHSRSWRILASATQKSTVSPFATSSSKLRNCNSGTFLYSVTQPFVQVYNLCTLALKCYSNHHSSWINNELQL